MAPPQVPQITTQHPVPSSEISTTPIEMTDTRASPWLSGDRRWRDSGSSGPKTPVLGPTQEMERIEAVLVGTPPTTTRVQGSSNRSSRQWIATPPGPNSPVSPTDRTGMGFSQSQTAAPTAPAAAMTRQTAMLQIRDSVQRLQNGQLVTTTLSDVVLSDVEAQERPRGPVRKKWWWQKPRWKGVQNRLITAVIAGIMCLIVLIIYLALALSMRLQQEWHVLMILIIMVATLFFCHSLARLAIDLTIGGSPGNRDDTHDFARIPSIAGPGGYAMPRTPIRVNMQEPEIVSGMKEPPPVYGLWRCSVRVNPDQFYWERRRSAIMDSQSPSQGGQRRSVSMSPRPPSYLSDDGVSYAIDARPEIRTVLDAPLPPHPSERARLP